MRDLRSVGLEGKRLCVIQIAFCAGHWILDSGCFILVTLDLSLVTRNLSLCLDWK